MKGEYLSDNGAPCRTCLSTCVVYTVGRDHRDRQTVVRFCVCCHHRTNPELLPDVGDKASDLSRWDRESVNTDDVASYVVTGIDCNGKRFRIETVSYLHWRGINVWQGSKWVVLKTGKRKLMARIVN